MASNHETVDLMIEAEMRGLTEAYRIASERASRYAKQATAHEGTAQGQIETAKCGAVASVAAQIDSRINFLRSEAGPAST